MQFISRLKKSPRRKQAQPCELPARQPARDTCTTPPRRPAEIDAIVRAAHARKRSERAPLAPYALVEPAPKAAAVQLCRPSAAAAKPQMQAAWHTLQRTFSYAFRGDLQSRLAQAGAHDWIVEKPYYNFTLGRYMVALHKQVWGTAQPVQSHVLRGGSPSEVNQALGRMEDAGWHVTEVRVLGCAQLRPTYEVHLQWQHIDALPAPQDTCQASGIACVEKVEV